MHANTHCRQGSISASLAAIRTVGDARHPCFMSNLFVSVQQQVEQLSEEKRKRLNEHAQTAKDLFTDRWQPISHLSPEGARAAACSQNANEAKRRGGHGPVSTSRGEKLTKEAAQVHCGETVQAYGWRAELPAGSITALEKKISQASGSCVKKRGYLHQKPLLL